MLNYIRNPNLKKKIRKKPISAPKKVDSCAIYHSYEKNKIIKLS